MDKNKIIHLQALPILSGVQSSMLEIITRLDPEVYDVTVLCQSEGDLTDALKQQGIKYVTLPELKRNISPYHDILAFSKLYKLFKKERYDIVHTHSSKPGFIGRLAARAAGVKCVVHTVQGFAFHEHSSMLGVWGVSLLEKIAGWAATKVIFVNNQDRNTAAQFNILPKHKMITIYNGIDLGRWDSKNGLKDAELISLRSQGPLVAMVARLWKQKAPEYFIAAVPNIVGELPKTKFLVIGDGPLQDQLKKLCVEYEIADRVLFLGWRSDVVDLLKLIDVFVLPSLWEGLPVSILEAMAAAKPVVATNIKGNNELVVHGETGFLVEPKNPDEISKYVIRLLTNPALARDIGERGKARVRNNFDISRTVQEIDKLYFKLLEERVGAQRQITKRPQKLNAEEYV